MNLVIDLNRLKRTELLLKVKMDAPLQSLNVNSFKDCKLIRNAHFILIYEIVNNEFTYKILKHRYDLPKNESGEIIPFKSLVDVYSYLLSMEIRKIESQKIEDAYFDLLNNGI